jgi:hypothetical protein
MNEKKHDFAPDLGKNVSNMTREILRIMFPNGTFFLNNACEISPVDSRVEL